MGQVYPSMFQWVTYPITSCLYKLWKKSLKDIDDGRDIDPYRLEFVAMLERTLNFAHTGNARVLTKGMNDTWLTRSLIADRFPALWKGFHLAGEKMDDPRILSHLWPVNKKTREPYTVSDRAQILSYGEPHFMVSQLCHIMQAGPTRWLTASPYTIYIELQGAVCHHTHCLGPR